MNHMEEAIDCPKIENARQKTAGAISGVRLEMLFAVVVAKVLEYRCGNHHFAQLAQKNAQANKILFGEGGVKMIGQGRNQDVKLARIQKNHPEHYMRAGEKWGLCGMRRPKGARSRRNNDVEAGEKPWNVAFRAYTLRHYFFVQSFAARFNHCSG